MNTVIALPNVSPMNRPTRQKAPKSVKQGVSPLVQPALLPSQGGRKVSSDLAKVHFAGINLTEAIKNSNQVASPQQLPSIMNMQEYVDTVQEHPLLLRNSPQYALDMINKEGVRKKFNFGKSMLEYDFFSRPKSPEMRGLEGSQDFINEMMLHIRAAARREDLGKKPATLIGAPGAGKTTMVELLVDGYERYSKTDEGARYATKLVNLPKELRMGKEYKDELLTDPLLFLTPDIRKAVVKSAKPKFHALKDQAVKKEVPHGFMRPNLYDYDLDVEGSLTPKAQYIMKFLENMYLNDLIQEKGYDLKTLEKEEGQHKLMALKRQAYQKVLDNHLQAYRFEYDPKAPLGGIGVFSATDPKTLNIHKISGQVSMVRLMDEPEADPRRYDYVDGAAFKGNRGIFWLKEVHKNPKAFYQVLLDLAQSQLIETDSGNVSVNTLILGDSNFAEFIDKLGDDELSPAMKRIDHIFVPYTMELSADRKIQDGLFSAFEKNVGPNGKPGHVAPHTKDIASLWGVMSRLTLPEDKVATEGLPFLAKKAAAYDGRMVDGVEEREVNEWYEKGQKTDDIRQKEGMDGLSVREMQTIANMVTGDQNVRELNSVDGYAYLRIARDLLEKNRLTLSEDVKKKSLDLLKIAEQHLDEKVKGDVAEVLAGDPAYLQNTFDAYLNNVVAGKLGKRVRDPLTSEMVPVDRELMEDIEKRMGLKSLTERQQYRDNLAAIAGVLKREGKPYQLDNDPKLKKAILQRAYARTVDGIDAKVLLHSNNPTSKDSEKQNDLVKRMMDKGYNEITAKNALARVRMLARRDPKILDL